MLARLIVAGTTALLFFLSALQHMAPGLTLEDSGELAIALYELGIPHPPGYPLYVLLGSPIAHLISGTMSLPQKDFVFATNIFSALCYCGAAFFMVLALFELTLIFRNEAEEQPAKEEWIDACLAAIVVLSVFHVPHFFRQALITEVYGLQLLISSLLIFYFLKTQSKDSSNSKFFFGCLSGLLLASHHIGLFLIVPMIGFLRWNKSIWFKSIAMMILGLLIGLLPYAFLPIRALQNPGFNWGDPSTASRFLEVISRAQYAPNLRRSFTEMQAQLQEWVVHLFWNFQLTGVVLLVCALLFVANVSRRWAAFFGLSWLSLGPLVILAVNFKFPVEGYGYFEVSNLVSVFFLTQYLLFALILFTALIVVRDYLSRSAVRLNRRSGLQVLIMVFALSILSLICQRTWREESKAIDSVSMELLDNLERQIRSDRVTIILTAWDPFSFTLLYAQRMMGRFPNVILLDEHMTKSPWFLKHLSAWQPQFSELSENATERLSEIVGRYKSSEREGHHVLMAHELLKRTLVHNTLRSGGDVVFFGIENYKNSPPISPTLEKRPRGLVTEYLLREPIVDPTGVSKTKTAEFWANPPMTEILEKNLTRNDRLHRMLAGNYALQALETSEYLMVHEQSKGADLWLETAERLSAFDANILILIERIKKQRHL